MGRFHLRKYCYLVLWAALLAAVAGVWFFGREPAPRESGPSPTPQASPAPAGEEEETLVGVWVPYFSLHTAEHTQQAFGIDVVVAVYDADDAGKAVGSLDEPGRRLMVQAVRDLDRDFSRAQHKKTSSVSPCRGLSARCDGTE